MAVEVKRRELKLFELKRVLAYASEVLEARRELEKLVSDEIPAINREINDWNKYMEELHEAEDNVAEENHVRKIVEELTKNEEVKSIRAEEIEDKITVYDELIETLYYYIFFNGTSSENLGIEKDEIDINFIEEYIYVFTQIESQARQSYDFDYVFDNKEDFADVILESYGRAGFELVKDILKEDYLSGDFTEYIPY